VFVSALGVTNALRLALCARITAGEACTPWAARTHTSSLFLKISVHSVCQQCVLAFDHHCPFTGNCVGWMNHKFFLQYVWATTGACHFGGIPAKQLILAHLVSVYSLRGSGGQWFVLLLAPGALSGRSPPDGVQAHGDGAVLGREPAFYALSIRGSGLSCPLVRLFLLI
jgi:hypothetical protein